MSHFKYIRPALNLSPGETDNQNRFLSEGYLVLKGVLDPKQDLTPLANTYARLVDDLFEYALDADVSAAAPEYETLDFPGRFAALVGMTRGSVFDHLDPSLNIYSKGYRRWANAPSAQPDELFHLMINPHILDVVEELIGAEIWATPAYHSNIKLASSHLQQMRRAENLPCKPELLHATGLYPSLFLQDFQMQCTPWHIDEYRGLGDPYGQHYINVWVPLTQAGPELAPLRVLPGSHLNGYCDFPAERESEAVVLDTRPGDIVLMAGKLFHSSRENKTRDSFRWAVNMRYAPIGFRCGRPILPGFVARSRKQPDTPLRDPELWRQYWHAALDYLDRYLYPLTHVFEMSVSQVDKLEKHWKKILPEPDSWLSLHHHGTLVKALRTSVLRMQQRLRGRLSVLIKQSRF